MHEWYVYERARKRCTPTNTFFIAVSDWLKQIYLQTLKHNLISVRMPTTPNTNNNGNGMRKTVWRKISGKKGSCCIESNENKERKRCYGWECKRDISYNIGKYIRLPRVIKKLEMFFKKK